jgi:hypothetical protein
MNIFIQSFWTTGRFSVIGGVVLHLVELVLSYRGNLLYTLYFCLSKFREVSQRDVSEKHVKLDLWQQVLLSLQHSTYAF